MLKKRLVSACVLMWLLTSSPASAADCGASGPDGGSRRGTLVLDDEASTVRRDFHRGGRVRTLQLVYDVTGCELRVPPRVSAGPLKDVDDEILEREPR